MPPATLAAIEDAILARLRTRLASVTPGAEFATVDRWAGTFSQDSEVDQASFGILPAAILAYEGTTTDGTNGAVVETILGDTEVVERHGFVVCVAVADLDTVAGTVQGGPAAPGLLACGDAVRAVLGRLRLPGLYRDEGLRLGTARPWRSLRGAFVAHLIRFTARTLLGGDLADDTESLGDPTPEPFERLTGTNGPVPGAIDLAASDLDLTDS